MLPIRQLMLSGLLAGSLVAGPASAQTLEFEGAWSPEAPPTAPVMAGYVEITNNGDKDVAITAARCDDFNKVEIHDMVERDGMMRMIQQERLTIPAGETVKLEKGGLHLMLMKPRRAIKQGETLDITFETAAGESNKVPFEVKTRSEQEMHHDNHQRHH